MNENREMNDELEIDLGELFKVLKKNILMIIVVSLLCAAVGLVSLIYLQFTQNAFNIADCIAMVLGVMLFTSAKE